MISHRKDSGLPEREAALIAEIARLRAALVRAGIDVDDAPATADAATGAGDEGGPPQAGARALNDDLRRTNAALVASEAALVESRRRLTGLFEMKTLGVMVWSPQFTLSDVNEAFLAMTGFRRDEALGMTWESLTPEEFRPFSQHAIEELLATGETTPYEKQHFRKVGSRWWGLFAARKVGTEAVEVVLDVTDRRLAQDALRENEEQLRLIVESAHDYAIFTVDTEGLVNRWWPGAAAVRG